MCLESSFLLLDLLGVVIPGNVDVSNFAIASEEVLDFIRPADDVGGRFIRETRISSYRDIRNSRSLL